MAAFQGVVVADNQSDGNFRAWTQFIHNHITGSGFVNVPVSGDIDFTTVTAPSTTEQKRGFKLYRFNDPLQSVTPIFFRVDFGSDNVATRPAIWLTVGFNHASGSIRHTGSLGDTFVTGSGSNVHITEFQLGASNESSTAHSHSWSSDGSFLMGAMWFSNSAIDLWMNIERTKTDGVYDARGVSVIRGGNSDRESSVLYITSGGFDPSLRESTAIATIHGTRNPTVFSGSNGHKINVSGVFVYGQFGPELINGMVTYMSNEFPVHRDIFVDINGEKIPYRTLGTTFRTTADWINQQNQNVAVRFQE